MEKRIKSDDDIRKINGELEQKVTKLTVQLENAIKDLDAFTYSISHDLRAPLRAINGYANIMRVDYFTKLDRKGMKFLDAILKGSKKMGDLIDDLQAFSRLGRQVEAITELNMHSLVKSIKIDEMNENETAIDLKIHELLPSKGQRTLIKQVWVSLISNAIKFSKNNPPIEIEIGSYYNDNNDQVVYYIKDTGVGFDMNYYDKLFKVFQRLHSPDEYEGSGIGLAIVKKIISNHNGTVWAESKVNEGSCFYFSLPKITS